MSNKKLNRTSEHRKSLFKNIDLKSEQDILQDIRYRTFIDVEDCLSEILIHRGDLNKVTQRYLPPGLKQEYQNKLYYSLNEMDERVLNNESSRPVINDLAEIDKYFVSAYREYVNNLKYKVEHDNFTSYGDLNIYQNETMMIYRIPVDITCPKFNKFFVCDKVDTTDSIILSLKQKYASFLQYYNVMNNILNEVEKEFGFESAVIRDANTLSPLSAYSDCVESILIEGLTDNELYQYLLKEPVGAILFTGGGIVPATLLALKHLKFLHVHPGFLPDIRGADCALWSSLITGHTSATCFYMSPGIDTGDIINPYWLPSLSFNTNIKNIDRQSIYRAVYGFLDPWVRAFVLRDIIFSNNNY